MVDQIGRVLDGRYRLIAPVGAGASGRVFLADDVRLRRRVAVKILHPSLADDQGFLRRFQAEAQAAAALNHPHVMAVYDWGHDEVPYLVTEYLGGGSLRALLDQGNRLSVSQALLVGLEAARALDYAHRRGFVHRDIKPANLLFGDDARLRIADFGLARALAEAGWTEPSGAVLGTARYASPEQAQGERVDGKADVYGLGLTLIEAVSGTVPFAADTTIATLMARIDKEVDLDESFGPLGPVLTQACHPNPAERPDASALAVSFMACAEGLPRPERLPLAGALEGGKKPLAPEDLTEAVPSTNANGASPDGEPSELDATIANSVVTVAEPINPDEDDNSGEDAESSELNPSLETDETTAKKRRRWPWVVLALVLLAGLGTAGGVLAAKRLAEPELYEVDNYVGVNAAAVAGLVETFGWSVEVEEVRETGAEVGVVLRQEPLPLTKLEEGPDSVLTVWVSIGNALVPVPTELEGQSREEAEAAIVGAGLVVGEVREDYSEDVPAGVVISTEHDPTDDGQLPEESVVNLVVSAGPQPRIIPNVAGGSFEAAEASLAELGLSVAKDTEASETVPQGQVIGTRPSNGTEVPRGSEVTVVVSSGMPFVKVPDVRGLSESDAAAKLEANGLVVGDRLGPPRREVLTTDPPAGESVRKGTRVTIITRST